MKCKVCGQDNKKIFNAKILNKYDIEYFHCDNCGFLQTEEHYWLEEAYKESINVSDTGIMSRNLSLSKLSTLIIYFFFNKNAKFLDYAGGYGIFVRLMRDIRFDFYWQDKFSDNLLARGFEYDNRDEIELITSFEAFEHFDKPVDEIESMLKISKNILFSTELYGETVPNIKKWGYYGLNHGQHISFYNIKTLQYIAKKYNLNLYTNGSTLHLFTEKKLNNFLFKVLLKMNRLGVFYVVKRTLNSKTMSDWELLK